MPKIRLRTSSGVALLVQFSIGKTSMGWFEFDGSVN